MPKARPLPTTPRQVPKKHRDRRTRWVAGIAGLAAALGTIVVLGPLRTAAPAPVALADFVLPSLRDPNAGIDSRNFRGKGLVLNFYFSDCPPCRTEIPLLNRLAREFSSAVRFLGVDHGEPRAKAERFLSEVPLAYDGALDEEGFVAPNLNVITFPTTLFVDAEGVVVKRHQGAISEVELRRGINLLSHAS